MSLWARDLAPCAEAWGLNKKPGGVEVESLGWGWIGVELERAQGQPKAIRN